MTATRSAQATTPGSGGAALELLDSGTVSVKTPTAAIRAANSTGDLVDVTATDAGRLQVEGTAPDLTSTGSITGASQNVATLALGATPRGMLTCVTSGTFSNLGLALQMSFDGGTTWVGMVILNRSAPTSAVPDTSISSIFTGTVITASIPPGVTHVRARSVSLSSGTAVVTLFASTRTTDNAIAGNVNMANWTGTVYLGPVSATSTFSKTNNTGAFGVWYDDTVTALGASATYTGTTRDVHSATAGNPPNYAGAIKEFRGLAISDVTGTLYLEVSRDNSTWRRIAQYPTTQPIASGLFVAEAVHAPKTRYARWVYVNGAGAQTHFTLQTMTVAA